FFAYGFAHRTAGPYHLSLPTATAAPKTAIGPGSCSPASRGPHRWRTAGGTRRRLKRAHPGCRPSEAPGGCEVSSLGPSGALGREGRQWCLPIHRRDRTKEAQIICLGREEAGCQDAVQSTVPLQKIGSTLGPDTARAGQLVAVPVAHLGGSDT